MDQFLETLQSRLAEAHKRFAQAQQAFQKAQAEMNQFQQTFAKTQAEFQSASQEFNSWQIAVRVESQKQQVAIPQQPLPQPLSAPVVQRIIPRITQQVHPIILPVGVVPSQPAANAAPEINKTEAIRQVLNQHPAGITPGELWKEVASQISQRPYMYSILKRLKDNEEVTVRRGKYFLKAAPVAQEGNRPNVIQ